MNILGQKVKTLVNKPHAGGHYSVKWGGRDELGVVISGGVYLYQLKAGAYVKTKKMLLLR